MIAFKASTIVREAGSADFRPWAEEAKALQCVFRCGCHPVPGNRFVNNPSKHFYLTCDSVEYRSIWKLSGCARFFGKIPVEAIGSESAVKVEMEGVVAVILFIVSQNQSSRMAVEYFLKIVTRTSHHAFKKPFNFLSPFFPWLLF